MDIALKRDFREETALNVAEFTLLKQLAQELGLSKSATLRFALHHLGSKFIKDKILKETGLFTED
jgi:hypothetical protein